jgi:hypothetical protein
MNMAGVSILPLFPLTDVVLLPGEERQLAPPPPCLALEHARQGRGTLVASLLDGDSVHEIGVRAQVLESSAAGIALRGLARCRLIALEDAEIPLVRVEDYPEAREPSGRARELETLLRRRYLRLCANLGRPARPPNTPGLSSLTWRVLAESGLSPEQQQGFLNVPGPVTRGRLLLVVVRDLERRERFLRGWAHLRGGADWN